MSYHCTLPLTYIQHKHKSSVRNNYFVSTEIEKRLFKNLRVAKGNLTKSSFNNKLHCSLYAWIFWFFVVCFFFFYTCKIWIPYFMNGCSSETLAQQKTVYNWHNLTSRWEQNLSELVTRKQFLTQRSSEGGCFNVFTAKNLYLKQHDNNWKEHAKETVSRTLSSSCVSQTQEQTGESLL